MAAIMISAQDRTVPMPEISREAKQDVFLVVLAEMIDNTVDRLKERNPELLQFMSERKGA